MPVTVALIGWAAGAAAHGPTALKDIALAENEMVPGGELLPPSPPPPPPPQELVSIAAAQPSRSPRASLRPSVFIDPPICPSRLVRRLLPGRGARGGDVADHRQYALVPDHGRQMTVPLGDGLLLDDFRCESLLQQLLRLRLRLRLDDPLLG